MDLNNRKFLIKWKNYRESENTKIPEENLDGCIDLSQDSLMRNDQDLSTMNGIVGCTNSTHFNHKNWQDMNKVIQKFNMMKKNYYANVNLFEVLYNGLLDQDNDKVYFIKTHCFVLIHYSKWKLLIIADGSNQCMSNINIRKELRSMLEIRLGFRTCKHQTKVDYCSSSAVLIGLEFVKAYKNNSPIGDIHPPKSWIKTLITIYHKYKSNNQNEISLHKRKNIRNTDCTICKKHFKNRRSLNLHTIKLHKQKNGRSYE